MRLAISLSSGAGSTTAVTLEGWWGEGKPAATVCATEGEEGSALEAAEGAGIWTSSVAASGPRITCERWRCTQDPTQ